MAWRPPAAGWAASATGASALPGQAAPQTAQWHPAQGPPARPPAAAASAAAQGSAGWGQQPGSLVQVPQWQQQQHAAWQHEAARRAAWAEYYQKQAAQQSTPLTHPGIVPQHSAAAATPAVATPWTSGAHPKAPTQSWAWGTGKSDSSAGAAAIDLTDQTAVPRSTVSFTVKPKRAPPTQRARTNTLGADEPEAFVPTAPAREKREAASAAPVWSTALKQYVNRAFATCSSDLARNKMEELLKEKITTLTAANRMDSVNWDNEPLPGDGRGSLTMRSETSVVKGAKRKAPRFGSTTSEEDIAIARRQAKFKKPRYQASAASGGGRSEIVYQTLGPVTGFCQDLEKGYFRLNEAPDPAKIRPLSVLRRSLKHVKDKWQTNGDYKWFCDQMKGIRQDLQLQGIRDDFTVDVYETHARTALEKADSAEFNQCQVQLRVLYGDGANGAIAEFTAYRILYNIYSGSNADQLGLMSELLNGEVKVDPGVSCVAHAMEVRAAHAEGNYTRFFKLYTTAPMMGGYVMDLFILRERKKAMLRIATAYRPHISVSKIQATLAFEDVVSCFEFLTTLQVVWVKSDLRERHRDPGGQLIDCKATLPILIKAASESRGVADWAK